MGTLHASSTGTQAHRHTQQHTQQHTHTATSAHKRTMALSMFYDDPFFRAPAFFSVPAICRSSGPCSGFSRGLGRAEVTKGDEVDSYVIRVELPGFAKEDTSLSVTNNRLTVEASRGKKETADAAKTTENAPAEDNTEKAAAGEPSPVKNARQRYTVFKRSWDLMEGVPADKIEAEQRDGILTIRVPAPIRNEPEVKTIAIA